jgi:sirohydrochlorin ferrochelatase
VNRAVLLACHGSRIEASGEAVGQAVDSLRKKEPSVFFLCAFLELQKPNISEGIELCLGQGADEVIVVPYFVQAGRHVVQDIPRIVSDAQALHPDKKIRLADYLGFDERIVSVVLDRISAARKQAGSTKASEARLRVDPS